MLPAHRTDPQQILRIGWSVLCGIVALVLIVLGLSRPEPLEGRHYYILAVIFATWIYMPSRFSLRSLLIVMTLVAVGLGSLVWFASALKSAQRAARDAAIREGRIPPE